MHYKQQSEVERKCLKMMKKGAKFEGERRTEKGERVVLERGMARCSLVGELFR